MTDALLCDELRTPFGRYGGSLSTVRADDLGGIAIRALLARHPALDPAAIDDVLYGCANQAGEDNRNVARMNALLAGGAESMSRASFVMPKATSAFARANAIYDTTIGWRFINPAMSNCYSVPCDLAGQMVSTRL